jgi:hypothetical protein
MSRAVVGVFQIAVLEELCDVAARPILKMINISADDIGQFSETAVLPLHDYSLTRSRGNDPSISFRPTC